MFTFPFGFYNSEDAAAASLSLWTWGDNSFGQLGDGTTAAATDPNSAYRRITTSGDWDGVHCGINYAIAIKNDRTLWGWGYNQYGELLDKVGSIRNTPVLINSDSWTMICAGTQSVLGIKTDGTLWAWGNGFGGRLGDGTAVSKSSPVQIGTDSDWTKVSIYHTNAVALKSDRTMWVWGNGSVAGNVSVPTQVSPSIVWNDASAGLSYTLAVGNPDTYNFNGKLYRWGVNTSGQLGGAAAGQLGTLSDYQRVYAGNRTSYFVRAGSVWVTGGQMVGNGTLNSYSSPVQLTGVNYPYNMVAHRSDVGGQNAAALVYFVSGNYYSTLTGHVNSGPSLHGRPTSSWFNVGGMALNANATENYAIGYMFSVGVGADNDLYVAGINTLGQLGDGATKSSPVQIGSDTDWSTLAPASGSSFAIKTNNTLWSWGDNANGNLGLGYGSTAKVYAPTQVGALTNWKSISASAMNAVAVKADGTLWSWGSGLSGGLGDGTLVTKSSPVQIGSANSWKSAGAGRNFGLGVTTDGRLFGWGLNTSGQAGGNNRSSPTAIGIVATWDRVFCSESSSYAIRADGTLWAWGNNVFGQLGLGDAANKAAPVQVGVGTDWADVAVSSGPGGYFTAALKTDGTLWVWGRNEFGQLGLGDTTDRSSPVQVGSGTDWAEVAISGVDSATAVLDAYVVYARKTDGTLWGWGNNQTGLLMDGTYINKSSPVQIGSDTNWKSIQANGGLMMALRSA